MITVKLRISPRMRFFDQAFPKQETDFEKLSNYLELNAGYLPSMSVFDQAYNMYLSHEHIGRN